MNELIMLATILSPYADVWLGAIGGGMSYVFDANKARRTGEDDFEFKASSLFMNISMGAFVGAVVGSVVTDSATGRSAIIAFGGFSSYKILLLADSEFADWLNNKVRGKK